jgi:hypothetical protein
MRSGSGIMIKQVNSTNRQWLQQSWVALQHGDDLLQNAANGKRKQSHVRSSWNTNQETDLRLPTAGRVGRVFASATMMGSVGGMPKKFISRTAAFTIGVRNQ